LRFFFPAFQDFAQLVAAFPQAVVGTAIPGQTVKQQDGETGGAGTAGLEVAGQGVR
jgi:hypothetical protein